MNLGSDGSAGARLSLAAAMALGLRSGRSYRNARTSCVNVLLDYPTPCLASCAYCGLARDRSKPHGEASFIRVEWPTFPVELVADRIAARSSSVRRVCISMVENPRAFDDALALCWRIRAASAVPISVLVHPRGLDAERLASLRTAEVDRIGVGLDAASAVVFRRMRPGLDWEAHRAAVSTAREIFGPWKVNAHIVAGLGETDRELVDLFESLKREQMCAYLFSFFPEAGSRLERRRRPSLKRWRRLQLAKHLIEKDLGSPDEILFDDRDRVKGFALAPSIVREALRSGVPFRTDGCPDESGALACNRPFASYRPGESFRDYPFPPDAADLERIERELAL